MFNKQLLVTAILFAVVPPMPAIAEPDRESESERKNKQLETIVVRAAREPIELKRLGSAVTVLDSSYLQQRQLASVADILRAVPGVAVSRNGPFGAQTQLRLRGSEANQALVFIDGVIANDPAQGSQFDFAHLLNHDLSSIEVIRGPQSALWGSDAVAGVININTRRGEPGARGSVFVEGGSNSYARLGAAGAYGNERVTANLALDRLTTDGENVARSGSEDDGYENSTINGRLLVQATDALRLEANLRYTRATTDFDGTDFSTGLPTDRNNETDVERVYGRLAAVYDSFDGAWRHRFEVNVTDTDNATTSENAFAPSGFDNAEADARALRYVYQSQFALNEHHGIIVALERREENFQQRGPVGFGDPNRNEHLTATSVIAEYSGQPLDALSVQASLRRDDNNAFDDATTGRVSAAWQLDERGTRLRAAWGTGTKNPTFSERFGFFTDFIGNPELQPEESRGWEFGADVTLSPGARISATWFDESLFDEINGFVFDPLTGGFTAANQSGASQRNGLELEGRWRIADTLRLRAAYTWLDATERAPNLERAEEIRRAEHIGNLQIAWEPGTALSLAINVDYNGEQDDFFFPPVPPFQERVTLDDYTLVTLTGRYRFTDALTVHGRIENALDDSYEEVFGFAAPGRSAVLGVQYRFGG